MGYQSQPITFTLPIAPVAPALARETIRRFDQLADGMRPDLELLLSELVANAVRHSGMHPESEMEVRIWIEPGWVRAEVSDDGPGFTPGAVALPPPNGAERGFGLHLVDRLATRWGVADGGRPTVWFELREPL
jgi:anti-sigma regulatory factor (Ser/Thr protein kinase)